MSGWTLGPLPGQGQDEWSLGPDPSQVPNAANKRGWQLGPAKGPIFAGGPKKRLVDVSGSLPTVQRYIDLLQTGGAQQVEALGAAMEGLTPWKEQGKALWQGAKGYMASPMEATQAYKWDDQDSVMSYLGKVLWNTPSFVAENVVSQGANMAGNVVAFEGGTMLGGAVGGPIGAAIGAAVGPFAYNYFLNAGETYTNLREKGVTPEAAASAAGFTGAAKGLLDTVLPAKIGGKLVAKMGGQKFFWVPKDVLSKAPSLAKELFSGVAIEGGTEAGQELLDIWTEMSKGVYTPGEGLARVLNSFAGGAAGGGFMTGLEYALERKMERDSDPQPDPRLTEQPTETAPPLPPPTRPANTPDFSSLKADEVPGVMKERFMALGGEESLYKGYTEGEVKKILDMSPDSSLRLLVREGLLEEHKDGFHLSKVITGENALSPVKGMPGMYQDLTVTGDKGQFVFLDPLTGVDKYNIQATYGDPSKGTSDHFSTTVEGEVLEADNLDTMKELIMDVLKPPQVVQTDPKAAPIAAVDFRMKQGGVDIIREGRNIGQILSDPQSGQFLVSLQGQQVGAAPDAGSAMAMARNWIASLGRDHAPTTQEVAPIVKEIAPGIVPISREIEGTHRSSNLSSLENGFVQRDLGISIARSPEEELSSPTLKDRDGEKGTVRVRVKGFGLDYEGNPQHKAFIDNLVDSFIENPETRGTRSNGEEHGADTAAIATLRRMGVDWVNGWNGIGASPELHVLNAEAIQIEEEDSSVESEDSTPQGEFTSDGRVRIGSDDVPEASRGEQGGQAGDAGDLGRGRESGSRTAPTPTPVPASDRPAAAELKRVNKLIRNLDPDVKSAVQDRFGLWFRKMRYAYFLTQLVERNPNNPFVKMYLEGTREMVKERTKVLLHADALNRQWHKIGGKMLKKVSELTRRVEEVSFEKERRLSDQEVLELAKKIDANPDRLIEVWKDIDASMQNALGLLKNALLREADRVYGVAAIFRRDEIEKEFANLENRNYFPATRFGQYGVRVKATEPLTYKGRQFRKGQTIAFETGESERQAGQIRADMEKTFAGLPVKMDLPYLTSTQQAFLNMPESLVKLMEDRLDLTEEQLAELKQLQHELAPGRGLVKHLIKKKGVFGASLDVPRVYNDYYRKLAGHAAKIETSYKIEKALVGAKKWANDNATDYNAHYMAEALEKHYEAVQNPKNEWGAMAGAIYTFAFAFNPLAAVVNGTQVPMLTYPYLAKRFGDKVASAAIARAMVKVGKNMFAHPTLEAEQRNEIYTGEDRMMFDRAVEDGFLNESLAGEVAAMATGNMISKYMEHGLEINHTIQWGLGKSIGLHKLMEEFNRRVTFQAALEAGRTKGLAGDSLYEFARDAVDKTQFEYASWNRPAMMRGKTAILFVFKAYLQNLLYFAGTNQGGMRFWLMSVAIAGMKGVPGADDILDMIDLLGTWGAKFFGLKNPRVDSEKMARDFIAKLGANPDLAMNGISRYSLGLSGLDYFFGIPFPSSDFSSSMQISRLVPGIRSLKGTLQGTMSWSDAVATAFADVTGAAGTMGLNATRAVLEESPANGSRFWSISSAARNIGKAVEMAYTGAYRAPDGTALVDVDTTKPEHLGEIFMQALGKKPTRVSEIQEANWSRKEHMAFYFAWRDTILQHWANAIASHDEEAKEDAKREFQKFSRTAPPQFVMSPKEAYSSIIGRIRNRRLKELGLPSQSKFFQIYQDYENSWNAGEEH